MVDSNGNKSGLQNSNEYTLCRLYRFRIIEKLLFIGKLRPLEWGRGGGRPLAPLVRPSCYGSYSSVADRSVERNVTRLFHPPFLCGQCCGCFGRKLQKNKKKKKLQCSFSQALRTSTLNFNNDIFLEC